MAVCKSFKIKGPKGLTKPIQVFNSGSLYDRYDGQTYTQFEKTAESAIIEFSTEADNAIECYVHRREVLVLFESILELDGYSTRVIVDFIQTTGIAGTTLTFEVPEDPEFMRYGTSVTFELPDDDIGQYRVDVEAYTPKVNYTYNLYDDSGVILVTENVEGYHEQEVQIDVPTVEGYSKLQETVSFTLNALHINDSGYVSVNDNLIVDILDVYTKA